MLVCLMINDGKIIVNDYENDDVDMVDAELMNDCDDNNKENMFSSANEDVFVKQPRFHLEESIISNNGCLSVHCDNEKFNFSTILPIGTILNGYIDAIHAANNDSLHCFNFKGQIHSATGCILKIPDEQILQYNSDGTFKLTQGEYWIELTNGNGETFNAICKVDKDEKQCCIYDELENKCILTDINIGKLLINSDYQKDIANRVYNQLQELKNKNQYIGKKCERSNKDDGYNKDENDSVDSADINLDSTNNNNKKMKIQ